MTVSFLINANQSRILVNDFDYTQHNLVNVFGRIIRTDGSVELFFIVKPRFQILQIYSPRRSYRYKMIGENKKSQYWNHFTDESQRSFRPKRITDIRLKQIKEMVFNDDFLWQEVILRHDALEKTPDELQEMLPPAYELARSNFWAMIREKIQRQLTKSTRKPR